MSKLDEIGPLIGRGNVAEVFAFGDHVLKLYRPGADPAVALGEALAMSVAAGHGLPVPAVFGVAEHSGRWGVEMARAAGVPLAQVVDGQPGLVAGAIEAMIALQVQMHQKPEARLPALKPRLADRIARAPGLDAARRAALLARLAALPDDARLCHGDFHPFNLVGAPPDTMIIDWADATSGPAAADACPQLPDYPAGRGGTGRGLSRRLCAGQQDGPVGDPRLAAMYRRCTAHRGPRRAGRVPARAGRRLSDFCRPPAQNRTKWTECDRFCSVGAGKDTQN